MRQPEKEHEPEIEHELGVALGGELHVAGTADASANNPFLCWTGSRYSLAWTDTRGGSGEVYFATLTP